MRLLLPLQAVERQLLPNSLQSQRSHPSAPCEPHMAGVRHLRQAGCKQLGRQLGLGGRRDDPVLPAGHKQHLAGAVAQLRHQAGAGVEGIDGLPLREQGWAEGEAAGSGQQWR